MSAASAKLVRLAAPVSRVLAAQTPRAFTTTAVVRKSAAETVKDGLKSVDRAVSDNIAIPALDAAAKVKETAQNVTKGQLEGKVDELRGEAAGKAEELRGDVAGKAEELKGRAKGAAHEATGKAKGAAEQAKGAAEHAKNKL